MTARQRQNLLQYLGYYEGSIDGIYGPQTKQAVEDFQRDCGGIGVDGVAGAQTDAAILNAVAKGQAARKQTGSFWEKIRHFTRDEAYIGCPCGKCGGFPVEPTERLMLAADAVREYFGSPMIPTSTVRCQSHNAAVGGVWNSRHMEGRAMDFYVKGIPGEQVLDFVRTLSPGYAYIIGGDAVHMDF